jgi:uncharacterized protein YoxC
VIDERKLKSLKRASQVIAALSIMAFLALLGYSAYKLYSINRNIADAKENLKDMNAEVERLANDIKVKQKEFDELNEKSKAISEVNDKIANIDRKIVEQAVNEVIQSSPRTADVLPRIYIQIRDESQRPPARRIASRLQANGFIVPGIENVGDKASGSTTVKYFHKNDEEANDAKKIVDILRGEKIMADAKYTSGYDGSNKVRPRRYELWLGAEFSPPRPKDIQQKAAQQKEVKQSGVRK